MREGGELESSSSVASSCDGKIGSPEWRRRGCWISSGACW